MRLFCAGRRRHGECGPDCPWPLRAPTLAPAKVISTAAWITQRKVDAGRLSAGRPEPPATGDRIPVCDPVHARRPTKIPIGGRRRVFPSLVPPAPPGKPIAVASGRVAREFGFDGFVREIEGAEQSFITRPAREQQHVLGRRQQLDRALDQRLLASPEF